MITLCIRGIPCQVGVVCVAVVGSQWTTFYYIVLWRVCCGVMFFAHSGFSRCYPSGL